MTGVREENVGTHMHGVGLGSRMQRFPLGLLLLKVFGVRVFDLYTAHHLQQLPPLLSFFLKGFLPLRRLERLTLYVCYRHGNNVSRVPPQLPRSVRQLFIICTTAFYVLPSYRVLRAPQAATSAAFSPCVGEAL